MTLFDGPLRGLARMYEGLGREGMYDPRGGGELMAKGAVETVAVAAAPVVINDAGSAALSRSMRLRRLAVHVRRLANFNVSGWAATALDSAAGKASQAAAELVTKAESALGALKDITRSLKMFGESGIGPVDAHRLTSFAADNDVELAFRTIAQPKRVNTLLSRAWGAKPKPIWLKEKVPVTGCEHCSDRCGGDRSSRRVGIC
jgi:hypothetical protein